jgi:hypothetical protein
VGDPLLRFPGKLSLHLRRQVDDVELVVTNERDLRPIFGQLGIDLGTRRLGDALERPNAALKVQIASERDDGHVGLLRPDDLGDAGFP